MIVVEGKCFNCSTTNKECVELNLLFIVKYKLCQSCVSKSFRSFSKDR